MRKFLLGLFVATALFVVAPKAEASNVFFVRQEVFFDRTPVTFVNGFGNRTVFFTPNNAIFFNRGFAPAVQANIFRDRFFSGRFFVPRNNINVFFIR